MSETQDPQLSLAHMAVQIAETRLAMVELAIAYEELTEQKRRLARAIRDLVEMRLLNPALLPAAEGERHVQRIA
jgi:hypothetical protein